MQDSITNKLYEHKPFQNQFQKSTLQSLLEQNVDFLVAQNYIRMLCATRNPINY